MFDLHKITFFPLGNADCCLIDLANGYKLLFDYAQCRKVDDTADLRIDLATALKDDLKTAGKDHFDVVAFTHADDDHIQGASDIFYLRHAKKYQGNDRIKIGQLWVPAAMIVEKALTDDARVLQAEARYRLREGRDDILVFSRPDRLNEWLEAEGITLSDQKRFIIDAGTLIPGFSKFDQGVEFFVHSPFAAHLDGELVDRNGCSLIVQATFDTDGIETKLLLSADAPYDVLADMVTVTKNHKNNDRLAWDIFKVPHHCSYLSLNSERGTETTEPVPEVKWLFEQGRSGAILISTSKPIPSGDADTQPPHRQAANYYNQCIAKIDGEFSVTMEHPTKARPEPLVITVDVSGATVKKAFPSSTAVVTSRSAPRAG